MMVASPPPHLHAQHHATAASPYALPPVRPRNDIDLNRERLITVLTYFSQLLETAFDRRPFRLVVHGGACMLLHPTVYALSLQQHKFLPDLPYRTKTRDVDYIHRSFTIEMAQVQVSNAAGKLKECILATARHFNLGADWMNSDADIALPMATAPNGVTYDPIYHASVQPNNIELHTIFRSRNGMLTLISVTPFWAVSLKLVRYSKQDAADISLLLRNGTILSNTKWSVETLREWLFANCWAMGYSQYDVTRLHKLNERLEHAIQMVAQWEGNEAANPRSLAESAWSSVNVAFTPPSDRRVSPLAAMGGGEVVGGEHGGDGWKPTWPSGSPGFIQVGRHSQSSSLNPSPHGTPPEGSFIPSDEKSDKFFVPPIPHFHDPADFTVARHTQDIAAAAARKARKKAKARKSLSSAQSPSPPPSYNTAMGYGSRPTSPWGFYAGQAPPDHHGPGLSSLRSLDQSLGQMLHSQYPHPPQAVPGMYSYASKPAAGPPIGSSPKASDKSKKKKDKRKKEKEKERQRERERGRLNKWMAPREHGSPVGDDDSESDLEEEEDDDGDDSGYDYSHPRSHSHPSGHGAWSMYLPQQVQPSPPKLGHSYPIPNQAIVPNPSTSGLATSRIRFYIPRNARTWARSGNDVHARASNVIDTPTETAIAAYFQAEYGGHPTT
ncbi:hypothetical protein EST38_g10200 [Candolleomyces aberdarensis]|uniref:Uncharacterized protein n=1 Tax=Candolleomyces aberdarensis TaxID=2316362 RepID=A0A4Q2DB83_9AGAR|nr:hypothetical protein EST38_g10200 [Candolleomyces aberdarensis]